MALSDVKISELPLASAANDTDQLEVNQSGISRRVTVEQITGDIADQIDGLANNTGVYYLNFNGGAVGDGIADDTAAIQAAITAAAGKIIDGGGLTYKITVPLTDVASNTTIRNATFDGSTMAGATALDQVFGLKVQGTIGASATLTASPAIGDKVIAVPTAGLAAGDIILITSDEIHPVGAVGIANRKGELHRVRSIDSASGLTITDGLFLGYDYTQAAIVRKVTPKTNVAIQNVHILMGGVGKAHNGILFEYAVDGWLDRCSVSDAEDCGVRLHYCFGGGVDRGEFINSTSPADGGSGVSGTTGYGVVIGSGCRNTTVRGAHFRNNRHSIAGGGTHPAILCDVLDNYVDGGRTSPSPNPDIECHEDCMRWTFRGNTITGSLDSAGAGGLMVRGQDCVVDGNKIINSRQYGIYIHSYDTNPNGLDGVKVVNNTVIGSRLSGIYADGDLATPLKNVEISNNTVRNCGGDGIVLASVKGGRLSGNTVRNVSNSNQSAIRLLGVSGDPVTDIICDGNRVDTATLHGFFAAFADRVVVTGLVVRGTGAAAVRYTTCTNVSHAGGHLTTSGGTIHGIQITDCLKVTIGAVISDGGGGAATSAGVSISGVSSDILVSGSVFMGYQYPVRATGTVDYISTVGVNGRGCNVAIDLAAAVNKVTVGNL